MTHKDGLDPSVYVARGPFLDVIARACKIERIAGEPDGLLRARLIDALVSPRTTWTVMNKA